MGMAKQRKCDREENRCKTLVVEETSSSPLGDVTQIQRGPVCGPTALCGLNILHSIALLHYWAIGVNRATEGSDAALGEREGSLRCGTHSTWDPICSRGYSPAPSPPRPIPPLLSCPSSFLSAPSLLRTTGPISLTFLPGLWFLSSCVI